MPDIIRYSLDVKGSQELASQTQELEKKACYSNVYYALFFNDWLEQAVDAGEVEVVYGYLKLFPSESVWVRHCFFLKDGKALDPTVPFLTHLEVETLEYLPYRRFTNLQDYYNLLQEDTPDLGKTFAPDEQAFVMDCFKAGIFCVG